MREPELHITVVAFTSERGFALSEEMALVKAALLYADRVTLASPKAAMIESIAGYLDAPESERHAVIRNLLGLLPDGAQLEQALKALRSKKHRSRQELIFEQQLNARLRKASAEFDERINTIIDSSGMHELNRAGEAGLLKLDALGVEMHGSFDGAIQAALGSRPASTDEMVLNVSTLIGDVLGPTSRTHPMFSEMTGGLARAMVKEGKIAGAELAPATQAGIAGRFISAIEAFPDAPMDVVLDAREKLRKPLTAFRSGVIELSHELDQEEISAIDPRFERASADLYRQHVVPALQEIEELSRDMRLLPALARSAPGVAKDIAMSAAPLLTLAVTSDAGFTGLAAIAAAGKAGMTAADLLGRAATRQHDANERRGKNQFVWLYEAAPLLRAKA